MAAWVRVWVSRLGVYASTTRIYSFSKVWSLTIGTEIWDTDSWVQDLKPCTETNGRPCCREGERPPNADLEDDEPIYDHVAQNI
ncbi:hypothetical protein LguiA_029841 [Lonicera macranthoides]